jgi:hypothetical protein
MKKVLVLFAVLAGMASCGDNGSVTPDVTLWYTVLERDWTLVGGPDDIGSYYECVFDVPRLSENVYNNGLVFVYYEYNDNGTWVLTPLPYTYYDIIVSRGIEYPYAAAYSYDITPGTIAFRLTYSDFLTGQYAPPASSKFRLTLVF